MAFTQSGPFSRPEAGPPLRNRTERPFFVPFSLIAILLIVIIAIILIVIIAILLIVVRAILLIVIIIIILIVIRAILLIVIIAILLIVVPLFLSPVSLSHFWASESLLSFSSLLLLLLLSSWIWLCLISFSINDKS